MGSIPVIVGSDKEIKETYFWSKIKPSFIYSTDWDSAISRCKNTSQERLQEMQNLNYKWWKNQIEFIQNKIKSV